MNIAIFTDNDFGKVNGVTTTLTAALDHAPPGMHLRIYTAAVLPVDAPDCLALTSFGVPIPFYGEMDMFVPRLRAYAARARKEQVDVMAAAAADGREFSHGSGGVHSSAEWIAAARRADARVHALAVRQVRTRARAVRRYAAGAHRGQGARGQD